MTQATWIYRIRMRVEGYVKPENCYPRECQIVVPGAMNHNGSGEPFAVYQRSLV